MTRRRYATRRTTNHVKHIVWGVLTGGIWLVTGYPICVLLNRRPVYVTNVDDTVETPTPWQ